MIHSSSPCFNKETKTDCPNRHAGCAINCEKWAEWEERKQSIYMSNKNKNEAYLIAEKYHRKAVQKSKSKSNGRKRRYG